MHVKDFRTYFAAIEFYPHRNPRKPGLRMKTNGFSFDPWINIVDYDCVLICVTLKNLKKRKKYYASNCAINVIQDGFGSRNLQSCNTDSLDRIPVFINC